MRIRPIFVAVVLTMSLPLAFAQPSAPPLARIKAAAEAGDPIAQDKFAEQFIMQIDTKQAEFWYRKAAAQGYGHAQGKLGNMLLNRSRMTINRTAKECAALGEEAVHWATLAATQGDKRGQADLADIYLDGKLVKPDLVEAFKWGDLAARGSMIDTATITGRSTRDAAILKMSPEQVAEAQRRVAAFAPHMAGLDDLPEPSWVKQIKLSGLSGPSNRRLALITGTTFSPGETASVKVAGKSVKVRCLEIRKKSVLVVIDGVSGTRELAL